MEASSKLQEPLKICGIHTCYKYRFSETKYKTLLNRAYVVLCAGTSGHLDLSVDAACGSSLKIKPGHGQYSHRLQIMEISTHLQQSVSVILCRLWYYMEHLQKL
jgi:hypothetical protein